MSGPNRRLFLAASAAVVAAPVLLRAQTAPEVDVAIIGAGAAGIAAARRVAAANRRFVLLEATNRIGGRCVTDTAIFGMPFDLGARWIHRPDGNPPGGSSLPAGLDVYAAPRGQVVRVGPRNARDAEMESFLSALVRSRRAILEAGKTRADGPAVRALPADLGDWRATMEFVLGPFVFGKDLAALSVVDLARMPDRDNDAFCRQGYGALIAKLASGLPVRLSTPAVRVEWDRSGVDIVTSKGSLRSRAVIVTASTNVLAAEKIVFKPELSRRQLDAAAALSLGSYDHIGLDMPRNPLNLQRDDLVFEKSSGRPTAALLANVSGSSLHVVEVAGDFGRELSTKGTEAMIEFAQDWVGSLFGSSAKKSIKRSYATRWNEEPFILGAMSAATPGGADARRILAEPIAGRVWFAGEALHETQWGTVNGAWESGQRTAEAALRQIGALKRPEDEKPPQRSQQRHRRRGGDR
ncbi:MAG TPA: NAD(P)/FAD-dependent oxidoreductase [Pseudolabrys sp.]|nr:NAD(P)/FAD-dependent oxidoreductase [Pseudolabrys sp.]